jgi:hypothetical protein
MPEETKKKSSKKKWLYAGGALAGLAALGALAAWLLGRKRPEELPVAPIPKDLRTLATELGMGNVENYSEGDLGEYVEDALYQKLEEAIKQEGLSSSLSLEDYLQLYPGSEFAEQIRRAKELGLYLYGPSPTPFVPEKIPIPPKPKE